MCIFHILHFIAFFLIQNVSICFESATSQVISCRKCQYWSSHKYVDIWIEIVTMITYDSTRDITQNSEINVMLLHIYMKCCLVII